MGFYTLLASVAVGPKGKVFSFEPSPRNLTVLRRHLELNRVKNCSILEAAVGRSAGIVNFELGSHPLVGHVTEQASSGTVSVKMVALDKLVESGTLPPPNLIKCDIEGAEFDALTGAAGILSKYAPVIFSQPMAPKYIRTVALYSRTLATS